MISTRPGASPSGATPDFTSAGPPFGAGGLTPTEAPVFLNQTCCNRAVLVRACDQPTRYLRSITVLPGAGQPIASLSDPDAAWRDVVQALRAMAELAEQPEAIAEAGAGEVDDMNAAVTLEALGQALAEEPPETLRALGIALRPTSRAATRRKRAEAWLFDQYAARDANELRHAAGLVSAPVLADGLRALAARTSAGWAPSLEKTHLIAEQRGTTWHIEVRFGFLGCTCVADGEGSVRLEVAPGTAVEVSTGNKSVVVQLLAGRQSPVTATQARVWAGTSGRSKQLRPRSADALRFGLAPGVSAGASAGTYRMLTDLWELIGRPRERLLEQIVLERGNESEVEEEERCDG